MQNTSLIEKLASLGIIRHLPANTIKESKRSTTPSYDESLVVMFKKFHKLETYRGTGLYISDLFTRSFWSSVVIDSTMSFYKWWSFLVSIVLFIDMLLIIPNLPNQGISKDSWKYFLGLEVLTYFTFVVDLFISSRLVSFENGKYISEPKQINKKYVTSLKFVLDVIAIVPTDIIYLLNQEYWYIAFVKLNHLTKIYRMSQCFHMFKAFSTYPNIVWHAMIIFIIVHWNSVIYRILFVHSVSLSRNSSEHLYSLWWSLQAFGMINKSPISLTTNEYSYTIVITLIGLMSFAIFCGNISTTFLRSFHLKVGSIKKYTKARGVDVDVQNRITSWAKHTWQQQSFLDGERALQNLPSNLQAEISANLYLDTLAEVEIFNKCERSMLKEMVTRLRLKIFIPGDYVFKKGDVGHEMLIVKTGMLQVLSDDECSIVSTLSEGAVIGELTFLDIPGNITQNRRTVSIRSEGYSDVFSLSKKDLFDVMASYPDAKDMLMTAGMKILQKNGLINFNESCNILDKSFESKINKITQRIEEFQSTVILIMKQTAKLEERLCDLKSPTEYATNVY